jgi:hypothetical protein
MKKLRIEDSDWNITSATTHHLRFGTYTLEDASPSLSFNMLQKVLDIVLDFLTKLQDRGTLDIVEEISEISLVLTSVSKY